MVLQHNLRFPPVISIKSCRVCLFAGYLSMKQVILVSLNFPLLQIIRSRRCARSHSNTGKTLALKWRVELGSDSGRSELGNGQLYFALFSAFKRPVSSATLTLTPPFAILVVLNRVDCCSWRIRTVGCHDLRDTSGCVISNSLLPFAYTVAVSKVGDRDIAIPTEFAGLSVVAIPLYLAGAHLAPETTLSVRYWHLSGVKC